MNTNKILGMATMLVLGTAMQASLAQSISSPYKIASETADVGSSGTFVIPTSTVFDVSVIPNRIISSTAPYFVVVTLTGGAQFSGDGVELQCGYSTTLAKAAAGSTALVDSPAAAAGGSVAAFKVQSAGANGAVTSCQLVWTAGSGIVMTSGNKDYGVSISNRHTDPSDTVTATVAGTIITFVQGLQASVSAGSVTIDVVSPALSKKFLVTGSVTSGTTAMAGTTTAVADLGVIRYTSASDIYVLAGTNAVKGSFLGQATITVSGSLIAGAVSATSGSTTTTGFVYLSNTPTCSAQVGTTTQVALAYLQSTGRVASGNQVSFVVSAADFTEGGAAPINSGIHVCMMPNDITTLEKGVVSFSVSVTSALSNSKPNLTISDTILTKVVKNGTSVKVLNLPPPDYTTDVAYVRFYNMGSVTGKVYGTLYSQGTTDGNNTGGGSVLGTSNFTLIESLAPGQVVTLSGPAIGSKVGLTTWPGRAWMQVESEVRGLRIQALIRSGGPQGTLTNMSDRIMADGETLQRTD